MASVHSRGKKSATLALAAVLTITGAGAAYAYWTSTGSGIGSATTGESVAFTIASDPAVGTIAPGSAGQTVDFTVTNPGEGSLYLAAVTVTLATSDGTAWVPAGQCLRGDYTATISTAPTPGVIVAGGIVAGVATVTLANSVANQDDCQGQQVPLYFVAA